MVLALVIHSLMCDNIEPHFIVCGLELQAALSVGIVRLTFCTCASTVLARVALFSSVAYLWSWNRAGSRGTPKVMMFAPIMGTAILVLVYSSPLLTGSSK